MDEVAFLYESAEQLRELADREPEIASELRRMADEVERHANDLRRRNAAN
jgi:demethoxyubiquinone hydroxylase (CLK1/Coq7/Cat5 family)